MSKSLYPDYGNALEDAYIIRNAVYFSTEARVYSAELIIKENLDVGQKTLNFLVVRAFEEFMTSSEDLLGWLFALNEWKPGTAENSLFVLLDRIQVGRKRYSEKNAVVLLEELDEERFRRVFHIPEDEELISMGISGGFVDKLRSSLAFKIDGWLRIARIRAGEERGRVGMFNKLKHHMIAFPTKERGKDEVWVPYNVKTGESEIRLGRGWLRADAKNIRRFVGDAIGAQAVLHDTLACILIARYGEQYSRPNWIDKAYENYLRDDGR